MEDYELSPDEEQVISNAINVLFTLYVEMSNNGYENANCINFEEAKSIFIKKDDVYNTIEMLSKLRNVDSLI